MNIPALPIPNLICWVVVIAAAAVGFFVTFFQERQLWLPKVYFGYCALAGLIQLILRLRHSTVPVYWAFEVANGVVLSFASIELLSALISLMRLTLVAIPCLTLVGYLIVGLAPATATTKNDLEVSLTTLIVGLTMFIGWFFRQSGWTKESRGVFCGIALLTGLGFMSSLVWFANLLGNSGSIYFSQLSPIPGLLCLMFAGRKKGLKPPIILKYPL